MNYEVKINHESTLNQPIKYWLVLTGTMDWIMTFHSVGNVIIPTDFHSIIFRRGRYTTNQIMIKHESTNQIWIQLGFLHLRTAFLNFLIRCSPFFSRSQGRMTPSSFESRHSQRLAETKGSTWPGCFEGEAIHGNPQKAHHVPRVFFVGQRSMEDFVGSMGTESMEVSSW